LVASGGGGGASLQLILGNASIMVKPMPANEASKVKIGNVVDVGDVGEDKADNVDDA
jgi:hypothetical protein